MPVSGLRRGLILVVTSCIAALLVLAVLLLQGSGDNGSIPGRGGGDTPDGSGWIALPAPRKAGSVSVEEAIGKRRSHRQFTRDPVPLGEISQVLWASQGISDERHGFRTVPSAGALYPLEVILVAGDVSGLLPGVYRYLPEEHALRRVRDGDIRPDLMSAGLGQSAIAGAPATIVIAADYGRTTVKYGDRGIRYVQMEAGHAAQNVYLQAQALKLATVAIGAFSDEEVRRLLLLPAGEEPLYLMPVGYPGLLLHLL